MNKKYMLPAMKNNIEVNSKGCWESVNDAYDFLISNLKLYFEANTSIFEGGSNAIPHMFEQMLIFHKAFLDEKDPDHNRAVAEWRAVLSIMALQKVRNVNLDLILIELSDENKNPFLKAAKNFQPEDTPVFFNTTWDFLYVIRIKKIPVAIFSPVTLVCPAKLFLRKISATLDNNWIRIINDYRGEHLQFEFKGSKREILDLLKWLKNLKSNLTYSDMSGEGGECFSKFENTLKELNKFIQEYNTVNSSEELGPLRPEVYTSMNNNIRKEYGFLNNCCDVIVKNPKLRFLIDRYKEDIFEEKILVLVYDDAPDTIEKEENIYKLKKLYRNILEIENGKPLIEVYSNGGQRMAACVFLPFKVHFVGELIQNNITPNEFFESFVAVYNPSSKNLEITLVIKEFQYYFTKSYSVEDWQFLYGRDMEATYIWPANQVDAPGWKKYYIYTEEKNGTGIEVSVPEAVRQVKYINPSDGGNNVEFQLCQSDTFPAYLCYNCQGVNGFLPIWTRHVGTTDIGSTANIIIDMGHATTNISIINDFGDNVQKRASRENQEIKFQIPKSCRIAGNANAYRTVRVNFVIPDEENVDATQNCIKNMINSFRKYEKRPIIEKERKPFEDGQLLFDGSAYLDETQQSIISYINFEYAELDQIKRERVHIFIEQLLVYITYQIIARECSYIKVYFIHPYNKEHNDDAAKLGELKGLWKNAICNVRKQTGISIAGKEDAVAVRDCEALNWYVYGQIYQSEIAKQNKFAVDCINVGVNIGWKNTNVVFLQGILDDKSEYKIVSKYSILEYAGRNISMLNNADDPGLNLKCYPTLLKILLCGGLDASRKTDAEKMLEEFGELFNGNKNQKDITHFQGVFDLIAMKISEANFEISSDVFYNMYEFRYFIMALTYNIMLLFLNIGILIRKIKCDNIKKINLFLGGNGSAFIKWISNIKDDNKINHDNASQIFILSLEKSIIQYIADAASLDEPAEVNIIMESHADEQLVEGCKEMIFDKGMEPPVPELEFLENRLTSGECGEFMQMINEMCSEVFRDFPSLDHNETQNQGNAASDISAIDIIENERKKICRQIIEEINYISS